MQINKVEPVMDERRLRMAGKAVDEQVIRYYKVNDVQKFRFSRPFHREPRDQSNEFASLWVARTVLVTSYPLPGILRWFPVTASDTYHLSPLQNAIETMETANKSIRELIIAHANDPQLPLNPLSMKLNGIIDAAVMGGVENYEKAFFIPEYLEKHPEDAGLVANLKELIADQIPLLEIGLQLHQRKAPREMQPFQQRMEKCFSDTKAHVEQTYGKKTCDLKLEPQVAVIMRRQTSRANSNSADQNRLSEASMGSEGVLCMSDLSTSNVRRRSSILAKSSSSFSVASSRAQTIFVRATNSTSSQIKSSKREKREKEKNRNSSRKLSLSAVNINSPINLSASSQWYTAEQDTMASPLACSTPNSASPVFELRQELTSKRPLRTEVEKEKRLSRPSSGQFQMKTMSLSIPSPNRFNGSYSNRDSIATTDSTASEEDSVPPPLPLKSREADYCNLPDEPTTGESLAKTLFSAINPLRVRNKPPPPEPLDDGPPPTPPPKRPLLKPPTGMDGF
ncbi:hypothetical protein B566_EDAN016653 [Ephemera danica]|nr:hypothetical protein B566_EDAN016653 [Ephemera danica]